MIAIACIALTAAHPGFVFGRNWNQKRVRGELALAGGELGETKEERGGSGEMEMVEGK